MDGMVVRQGLATEGNSVARNSHLAARCWREAVAGSGLSDKEIAIDAGLTPQHYSKIASGAQGDLLGLAYRVGVTHPKLRRDFIARLAEAENVDPMVTAAQQLARACYRFMCATSMVVPTRRVL